MRIELINGTKTYIFKVNKQTPIRKITIKSSTIFNINTNTNTNTEYYFTGQKRVLNDILHKLFNLQPFTYNKTILTSKSIHAFKLSKKQLNDKNNKIREHIIGSIINNQVPENYYILNKWSYMKEIIFNYLNKICDRPYIKVECIHKSGRNHHYDFLVIFYYNHETSSIFNISIYSPISISFLNLFR